VLERVETNPGQGGAPLTLDKLPNGDYVQPLKIMLAGVGDTGPLLSPDDPMPVTGTALTATATGVGAPADAVATTDTGTFSLVAFFKLSRSRGPSGASACSGGHGHPDAHWRHIAELRLAGCRCRPRPHLHWPRCRHRGCERNSGNRSAQRRGRRVDQRRHAHDERHHDGWRRVCNGCALPAIPGDGDCNQRRWRCRDRDDGGLRWRSPTRA
jgi:hypothetical protein